MSNVERSKSAMMHRGGRRRGKAPKVPRNIRAYVKHELAKEHYSETKVGKLDSAVTNFGTTHTASLVAITQGDDQHERIGNTVRIMSIQFNLHITNLPATERLRCMVLQQKGQSGEAVAAADISGIGFNLTIDLDEFNVLMDRYYVSNSTRTDFVITKKISWPALFRPKVEYNGTAAANVNVGNIFYLLVAESNTPAAVERILTYWKDT